MPDQTVEMIARLLVDNVVCQQGVLNNLFSDHGANVLSLVIHSVCDIVGMRKVNTSSYLPQFNGLVEKMNHWSLGPQKPGRLQKIHVASPQHRTDRRHRVTSRPEICALRKVIGSWSLCLMILRGIAQAGPTLPWSVLRDDDLIWSVCQACGSSRSHTDICQ